jgi:hypothetical protein
MDLSSPANLLIASIYYILAGILAFFSIFGVYTLIRYGQSRATALGVSILYSFIFLSILSASYAKLTSILQ